MRFDLEHDWQGNMATPRKNLGEKTKLKLFLILTVIWIFTGLTGHGLWQSIESDSISQILDVIQHNEFIAPLAASNLSLNNPPLYSFVAAGFAKVFAFSKFMSRSPQVSETLSPQFATFECLCGHASVRPCPGCHLKSYCCIFHILGQHAYNDEEMCHIQNH